MATETTREIALATPTPVAAPRARRGLPTTARRALILLAILLLWQGYVVVSNVPPLLIPSPLAVAQALLQDIASGRIPAATYTTLYSLVVGTLLGTLAGFALASLAVLFRPGQDLLALLSAILNPLPSIAVLPLAMIWFGLNETAIIFVIVQATLWPIAIATDMGFRTISPTLHMVARNLGLRGLRLVVDVLLPAALPHILSGLKAGWAFGWRTVVAAELVFGVAGAAGGLGWYINDSRYFLNTANVFAGLVVISLLGILVDLLFTLIEQQTVVKWGMKHGV
ncbi:MAG TPA: ABC transporter permease [Chloroflexota bacterium]|jgi:NitT/TauT family transport system permease protein|nr:ABC transporter permease [Chloroflexota bacterium]